MKKVINIGFAVLVLLSIYLGKSDIILAIVGLSISILIYLFFNLYGSLYLSSNYFIESLTKPIGTTEKTAVLTFDDGPHEQTEAILTILEKHNCLASFFVIGSRIAANKDVIRKINDTGHIVGNHSYGHKAHFPLQLSSKIQNELRQTNLLIKDTIGKTPRFFRPPFGAMSPLIAHAVRKIGMKVVGWNLRSFDTKNDESITLKRVKTNLENKPNVIILLHDSTQNIDELLDTIIIYLKENNYKIIPLSDALKLAPYVEN